MPPRLTAPVLCALAVFLSVANACSQKAVSPPPAVPTGHPANEVGQLAEPDGDQTGEAESPAESQQRALERAIESDRLRLIALITQRAGETPTLREDPELLEIAERLPRLENELRLLIQQRQASESEEATGQ